MQKCDYIIHTFCESGHVSPGPQKPASVTVFSMKTADSGLNSRISVINSRFKDFDLGNMSLI